MRRTGGQAEKGGLAREVARHSVVFGLGALAGAGLTELGKGLYRRQQRLAMIRQREQAKAEAVRFTPEWLLEKVDLSTYEKTGWLNEVPIGWHEVEPPDAEFEEGLLVITTPAGKNGAVWHKDNYGGELAVAFRGGNVDAWQVGIVPSQAFKKIPDSDRRAREPSYLHAAVIPQAGGPGYVTFGVQVEGQFMPFPTTALEVLPQRLWEEGERRHLTPAGLPLIERPPVDTP